MFRDEEYRNLQRDAEAVRMMGAKTEQEQPQVCMSKTKTAKQTRTQSMPWQNKRPRWRRTQSWRRP